MLNTQYLVVLLGYFTIIFVLCYMANRRTQQLSDFMLGRRRLNGPLVALGAGSSDMGSWLLLALPGAFFIHGLNEIWLPIGLLIGAYFNWRIVSRRLRAYTEVANNSLTIPAYFDNRFHDATRIVRVIAAVVVLIFFTFYAAAGFVSGALLFQTAFHLSYHSSLWICAALVVGYTTLGGFLAISWIDFFQGTLVFLALIITPLFAVHSLGGWHVVMTKLAPLGAGYLQPLHGMTMLSIISLMAWGLGYFGQPHILVRFMAIRSVKELPQARRISMIWMLVSLLGAVGVGIIGHALFSHGLANPESDFLHLTQDLFIAWLAGILLSAVLSAIMSHTSALLLTTSSALTEDLFHRFTGETISQKGLILVSRLAVVLIALIAILLAMNPKGSILQLVSYAWAGLGAAFGPVIVCSLFWSRMNKIGALAGIITGTVTVIIWKGLLSHYGGLFSLYEIIPGIILASLAIVIGTLLTQAPSKKMLREFDQAKKMLQA